LHRRIGHPAPPADGNSAASEPSRCR
jgi:hypothetical protein